MPSHWLSPLWCWYPGYHRWRVTGLRSDGGRLFTLTDTTPSDKHRSLCSIQPQTDRQTHRGTADTTSRPDMAPLGLVVSLLLASSWGETLGQATSMFRRENGTFMATPLVTCLAKSQVACASRCAASNSPLCCGFTYHANGTCQMYGAGAETSGVVSSSEGPQESGDGSWSRSYHRDI